MITTKLIQNKYCLPMKRKFRTVIDTYIDKPEIQAIIKKSMDYKLSKVDYEWLIDNGGFHGKYQYLNWLCTIYIHPLTPATQLTRMLCKEYGNEAITKIILS